MGISDDERPCGIQIFGDDPECMAQAAESAMKHSPDIIDINMGCPAPKISGNGSGCAFDEKSSALRRDSQRGDKGKRRAGDCQNSQGLGQRQHKRC